MIIDIHAHYYPSAYLALIERPELPLFEEAPLRDRTIEERVRLMDRMGVDAQVLSVSQAQPYLADAAAAAGAASVANDLFTEVCRDHHGRFYTFAALPLPHASESIKEIRRVFDDPYVVGVTMGCSICDVHVDDPMLESVYGELNRRHATVFLHPRGERCVVDGDDYDLNWLVGAPFEDTVAALRLVLSGITDRYQDIRFIVPHLGGTLPFLFARVQKQTGAHAVAALKGMYYDTVSGSTDGLRCACESLGADRLLFGTDYPYLTESALERRLSYLEEVTLGPTALSQIRGETAAQLLQL